jgi:hypothetical protein
LYCAIANVEESPRLVDPAATIRHDGPRNEQLDCEGGDVKLIPEETVRGSAL